MKTPQRVAPGQAGAALAIGLIAMPAVMAASHPGTPPAAKPPKAAALAVSVTDGRSAARAGDKLSYTVTVRNTGTAPAKHLKVTQTLSPGLKFLSASDHGTAKGASVSWSASLTAGGAQTFRVAAQVSAVPAQTLRLAAVACVALPGSARPAVCAAHLDRLPTAATAAPAARAGVNPLVYAAAAVAALALGLLAAVTARRRARLRRQAF